MALHAVNLMTTRQLVVDIDRFCSTAEIVSCPRSAAERLV